MEKKTSKHSIALLVVKRLHSQVYPFGSIKKNLTASMKFYQRGRTRECDYYQ